MGSILAPFRPSGPLCFPVRQRAFSASGGRAAAATGAAGGFYVSLCLIVQTAVQKMVENYCFSRVSEGTLGSFWARFWWGPLCFPVRQRAFSASGGRAAAATGAAGGFYVSLCLIVQTAVQKLVENYCFSRVSEGTLGSFWARFWRCSVLQGHCVSLSGSVRSQLREEEQQQQQEQQEGSMSHYVSLCKQRYKNWSKTIVFLGFQKGR